MEKLYDEYQIGMWYDEAEANYLILHRKSLQNIMILRLFL
jgi:hypothetical protein